MVARGATMVASWSLRGAFAELWRHLGATGNSSNNDRPWTYDRTLQEHHTTYTFFGFTYFRLKLARNNADETKMSTSCGSGDDLVH